MISVNMEILKKSLLQGLLSGAATWFAYGVVYNAIVYNEPIGEALFGIESLVFFIIAVIVESFFYFLITILKFTYFFF